MTVRDLIQDSAAGASLSSTASALETYRDHFKKQFVNPHTIFQQTILDFGEPLEDESVGALAVEIFPDDLVASCILKAPAGKAPEL